MATSEAAEKAIVARSTNGVTEHNMGTGWHVIVAKHNDLCATWYYHTNDDPRIRDALKRDAERRFYLWRSRKS